ncbi:unnamed protein product [Rotaria magnacalcarata]|uniref:Uncharacterized protein n=1 Tax=Rotaria magnacalcarata TaxID=392030 RepID=A0A816YFQ4_9BILA|nr:unnamed protein product [Rotaria magnacalcarata]CAF4658493.1 unnamed protein product [Rotaria magnacalcarata]
MTAIACSSNKITDYVNRAIDRVFVNDEELIALDPGKQLIDNDPRIKAIKDGVQLKYKLEKQEFQLVWPSLRECILVKRHNVKKKTTENKAN